MKAFFDILLGTDNYGVVVAGAVFVLLGVLLRTLYNFARNVKSKDKPAQWWAKKVFAFLLGCLLMRFATTLFKVENIDYGFCIGAVLGFFPDMAIHYLFAAKKRVSGSFKDRA